MKLFQWIAVCSLAALLPLGAWAQLPFEPVDTSFGGRTLRMPGLPLHYEILFSAKDQVADAQNRLVRAKAKFDFMAYAPIDSSSTHGYLWVNHESTARDTLLGDGGGASVLEVEFLHGRWRRIGSPRAVAFDSVGGTWNNCLGALTPWGTVLTSEEYEPLNNAELHKNGFRDTTAYKGFAKYLNYGWMVEVDPVTRKVLGKRWQMGRFSHEGALVMPDRKTVYLLDDFAPGVFFKFIAHQPNDLSAGQLYAYKQTATGGTWLPLPMTRAALNFARNEALKLGATMFIRPEDLVQAPDGRIFLTETGSDQADLSKAAAKGGVPAAHLAPLNKGKHVYNDYFGRILVFDPRTDKLEVFLEGGRGNGRSANHLANPDNLSLDAKRNFLIIHEDIYDTTQGRVGRRTADLVNEIYYLDLSIKKPTVDDLRRFAVLPLGAESTGSCFTPDYETLFFNIQHPSPRNTPPFDKDCTVGVTGFGASFFDKIKDE